MSYEFFSVMLMGKCNHCINAIQRQTTFAFSFSLSIYMLYYFKLDVVDVIASLVSKGDHGMND